MPRIIGWTLNHVKPPPRICVRLFAGESRLGPAPEGNPPDHARHRDSPPDPKEVLELDQDPREGGIMRAMSRESLVTMA
jgi:hypothetical protein